MEGQNVVTLFLQLENGDEYYDRILAIAKRDGKTANKIVQQALDDYLGLAEKEVPHNLICV